MTRWRALPLRTQLPALLLVTMALVLLVSGLAGAALLRGYLYDRLDESLRTSVAAVVDRGRPHLRGEHPPRRFAPPRDYLLALYDADGTLVAQEGLLDGGPELDLETAPRDEPFTADGAGATDSWRVVLRDAGGFTAVAAVPAGDVEDTVRRLLGIQLVVGLLALAAAGALSWSAVRRSLRRLAAVEGTAEAIAAGDLTRRVPPGDPGTEVGSLATSFNVMVDRFEDAYAAQQRSETQARASEERMRRFVGDAGHELRTPLTSIRGFAELFRSGGAQDQERVARRIEDEAARMGLLVEDLLLLARLDSARPLEREPVDLLSVAADVVAAASAVHASRVVRLHPPTGDAPPVVLGDRARLHQLVANLVGNALEHTDDRTTVDVRLAWTVQEVELTVADDGPGMAPEVAERVFERFYRADASRTRTSGGSGLGLSIVAGLVAAHGGTVEVTSAPGEGTTFTVRLPAG